MDGETASEYDNDGGYRLQTQGLQGSDCGPQ